MKRAISAVLGISLPREPHANLFTCSLLTFSLPTIHLLSAHLLSSHYSLLTFSLLTCDLFSAHLLIAHLLSTHLFTAHNSPALCSPVLCSLLTCSLLTCSLPTCSLLPCSLLTCSHRLPSLFYYPRHSLTLGTLLRCLLSLQVLFTDTCMATILACHESLLKWHLLDNHPARPHFKVMCVHLFPRFVVTSYPKLDGLKKPDILSLTDVQSEGLSNAMISLKALG